MAFHTIAATGRKVYYILLWKSKMAKRADGAKPSKRRSTVRLKKNGLETNHLFTFTKKIVPKIYFLIYNDFDFLILKIIEKIYESICTVSEMQ